ncbi:hypothetical protein [Hydrogenophaga crocea]|uniref:Uncharacterized protein n=1 Tax=Hydrogenophaga crocea TaxID=2716225 RepID=A0A6G8IIY4_9BURK|nr:hypothetical protein [Hydrogenophaga crocea]QIM52996.1 hypothetical protein G9Q37_13015 [Hydrogenophaga crocea]
MNTPGADDAALRRALREGLAHNAATDSAALQARVLAQWRQRHAQALGAHQAVTAGGPLPRGGAHRPRLALLAGALLLVALALTWSHRPDPTIDELLQPDVLSQIGLGEL